MRKYLFGLAIMAVAFFAVGHFVAPEFTHTIDPYAPMLGVAGVFTPANLLAVKAKATELWNDSQLQPDYVANVGALQAIKQEQTAILTPLQEAEKDNTLIIDWLQDCDETIEEDPADDCVVGGEEGEAGNKTYALNINFRSGFTIDEKKFRTIRYSKEEMVAKHMLRKMKAMDEFLTRKAIAVIEANLGVNQHTLSSQGTIVGTDTYIPPSQWDGNLMGYFSQAAIMNRMPNPYLLSGGNLYQATWQAEMNNLNADQKDQKAKMSAIRKYHDLWNIDQVNSPERVTYMINRGALAVANKVYFGTSPVEYKDDTRYSMASKNLPWLAYDVVYKNACVGNTIKHHWSFYVKAGIFTNPTGCDAERTGMLRFLCGSAPAS